MRAVRILIDEIITTLRNLCGEHEHAAKVLAIMDRMDLSPGNQHHWTPSEPMHGRELHEAIDAMPDSLKPLATALRRALDELQWRVDRGTYYELAANVGDGYRDGNMHCELIGPHGSAFHHDDFTLGLFLLKPWVLYRDHVHQAPELYLTLLEPSGWRFGEGEWQDVAPGTIIWNAPETSHATRVYDRPFLSIYSWTRDVHSKCRVVPQSDWCEIETVLSLAHSRHTAKSESHK